LMDTRSSLDRQSFDNDCEAGKVTATERANADPEGQLPKHRGASLTFPRRLSFVGSSKSAGERRRFKDNPMTTYSVYEPEMRQDSATRHAERFFFLRERFNFAAFLFGPLWMIWRRLWLVLVLYVVVVAMLEYGLGWLGVSAGARAAVFVLIQFLVGIEAAGLQRWTLVRRGWRDCGIVVAAGLELAERRFFDARAARLAAAKASATARPAGPLHMAAEPAAAPFVSDGWAQGIP
jgi:hypothetical protein